MGNPAELFNEIFDKAVRADLVLNRIDVLLKEKNTPIEVKLYQLAQDLRGVSRIIEEIKIMTRQKK